MSATESVAPQHHSMPAIRQAEADILARLNAGDDDAEGLLAFALHRRAFLDWTKAYADLHGRPPDEAPRDAFMLGETAERRRKDYRDRAQLMLASAEPSPEAVAAAMPMPRKRPIRTWFWPWGMPERFSVEDPERPVNWRGLTLRFLMLLVAVVVTALFLRFFFVRPG